jgi:acyl carrier protein
MPLGRTTTPAQDVRQWIGETVRTVTERDDLDPVADLFDQGVTSLAFIRAVAQINENYGVTVDVEQLDEVTVDSLTALVQRLLTGAKPE